MVVEVGYARAKTFLEDARPTAHRRFARRIYSLEAQNIALFPFAS